MASAIFLQLLKAPFLQQRRDIVTVASLANARDEIIARVSSDTSTICPFLPGFNVLFKNFIGLPQSLNRVWVYVAARLRR